jgi:hypothetical protein
VDESTRDRRASLAREILALITTLDRATEAITGLAWDGEKWVEDVDALLGLIESFRSELGEQHSTFYPRDPGGPGLFFRL